VKVIADINISVRIVAALQAHGHDVVRADAYVPATAPDAEIAELAASLGALVLTRDQDFAALLAMTRARAPSLYKLCERGDLPHMRVSNAIRFERRSVEALIAARSITDEEA